MRRVPVMRISTELPIAAETAFELAQKPELFKFVVAPILRVPRLKLPDRLEPGTEGSARLWWLGVVPTWTHHLRLVHLGENEIYTNEYGGPVHTWNHRLTFEPLSPSSCRTPTRSRPILACAGSAPASSFVSCSAIATDGGNCSRAYLLKLNPLGGGLVCLSLVLWLGSSATYSVRRPERRVGRVVRRGGRGRRG
jgi:hypothetical protein